MNYNVAYQLSALMVVVAWQQLDTRQLQNVADNEKKIGLNNVISYVALDYESDVGHNIADVIRAAVSDGNNMVAADDLAKQEARASEAMVLM